MSSMDTDSEEVDVSLEAAVGAAGLFGPLWMLSLCPTSDATHLPSSVHGPNPAIIAPQSHTSPSKSSFSPC